MKAFLRILSLFQVLLCVEMKRQSGNVVTGTEGGSVEIYCTYPDGYQYVSKYFCRDPCGNSDVLIKTETADKVISKGRYSIMNRVSSRSITVTIKNLRLRDSGVYYCGVDSWAKDRLSKVVLTVRKELPVVSIPAPESSTLSDHQITHNAAGHTLTAESSEIVSCPACAVTSSTSPKTSPCKMKETARFEDNKPPSTRGASSSVSETELVVFGVLCGVACAMLAVVLLFLYQDLCLRSFTDCTCSPCI